MRMTTVLLLLIIGIGLAGVAAQAWRIASHSPPDVPFTYCTVAEGYWSTVQFDERLQQLALMSRRRIDIVDTQSRESVVSLAPPLPWTRFIGVPSFSTDGSLVACPVDDGTVRLFRVETGEAVGVFSSWFSAALSQDGSLLATQIGPGEAALWNTETEQLLFSLSEFSALSLVIPLGFSSDDTLLFAAGIDSGSSAQITGAWDLATGSLIQVFPGTVVTMLDGSLLGLGSSLRGDEASLRVETRVSLWESIQGDLVQTFTIPDNVWAGAADPAGQVLALARRDGIVSFWDIEGQREIHQLDLKAIISSAAGTPFEEARIDNISFSPDGALLATATWMSSPTNRTYVHLWNVTELMGSN